MTVLFRGLAAFALALVIGPPLLLYGEPGSDAALKALMLGGTVLWFVSAYLGFRQNDLADAQLEEEVTRVP